MSDTIETRRDMADVIVSEVMRAYDEELKREAEAAGEDMAAAANSLRARFLERVAAARARAADPDADTLTTSVWDRETGDCPRSIGRYAILRRIGAGGMGVVYAAYDELLDRRLAIKVLHDHLWDVDGRRRERLLREAQALARITHPNVVTVHEVGNSDEQLFVVMEFVVGPTLKDWLVHEKRTWQQVVAVFRQIAEGIAAIHEAGLVHRDIKPSNVIVGDDGRVRVLDLGLVAMGVGDLLETDESKWKSSASSSSHDRHVGPLTMTGERLGTPAYMSREQFLGLEPTPASDVFSFTVALYEALYSYHPFGTTSFHELQSAVVAGQIVPPPSSSAVPAWLHSLVVRGLAPDPKDRPSSMRALSEELAHESGRGRGRWLGLLATAAVAALTGVVVARAQVPPSAPTCDGGRAAIAEVWNGQRATDIRAAIVATERPYAAAMAGRITDSLDDYASSWAEARDRACLEHARGEHSEALLDARMTCLDRRRQALAETVEILARADADVVEHAGQMVAKLPRLAACDELARVVEPEVPPAVAMLESRLVRAETLAHAGRVADATELAREVAGEAEALGQPSLVVRALLSEARAAILQFDRSRLSEVLDRALEIAIAEGLDRLAAEAMIRRLYVRGLSPGGSAAALADLALADAMLVRAGDDPELRALLLNNTGAIHAAAGEREAARSAFERALVVQERLFGESHLDVAVALANLGMMTEEPEIRRSLHDRMIAIYEQRLGPDHPRTLDARLLAAFHTADPKRAGEAFERLCPRFRTLGVLAFAGECELERGRIEIARGRLDVARGAFELAREQLDAEDRRILIDGYLALGTADPRPAIAKLRERIAAHDDGAKEWWMRLEQAERRVLLGRLLVQISEPLGALGELERALVDLEAIADQAQPIERERLLAGARSTLALALVAAEIEDPDRIAALAGSARAHYRNWPDAYVHRLDELDACFIPTGAARRKGADR
jgi:tetratricopeptide (TPR) repeat protein